MQDAEFKFVDRPWAGDKSNYTIDQLKRAVPAAMRRRAKRIAAAAKRETVKSDYALPYREANGDVNINGISAALGRIDQVKDCKSDERTSARAELESQRAKARTALDKPKISKNSELDEVGEFGLALTNSLAASLLMSQMPANMLAPPVPVLPLPRAQLASALDPGYQMAVLHGLQVVDSPNPGVYPVFDPGVNRALFNAGLGLAESASAPAPVTSLVNAEWVELAAKPAPVTNVDGTAGVVDNDYRPTPNWRTLGIDRPAGNATAQELQDLEGALRPDGTPLQPEDVFSVGAMVCNIDLIAQYGFFIPPLELGRLGVIASTRAIKSDQDHSRQVMSGNFTIAPSSVRIGTDPNITLHVDHPLLSKAPYTGLITRLLFQKIASDGGQMAAIEAVMAGKIQNLSIAFGLGSVSCALCGEIPIGRVIRENGNLLGFTIDPAAHELMCAMQPDDFSSSCDPVMGTLRTPADTEGGYAYRSVRVTGCTMDGTVMIEPMVGAGFALARGTVFMLDMRSYGFLFFGGGGRYCRFHGGAGSYYRDGRKISGAVTNIRSFINVAECDKGSVEARIVVDPDLSQSARAM